MINPADEELREKLLSFTKYIDINKKRIPTSIKIEFNDKFGGKGFAVIELPYGSDLKPLIRSLYSSAEDELDNCLSRLREQNSRVNDNG